MGTGNGRVATCRRPPTASPTFGAPAQGACCACRIFEDDRVAGDPAPLRAAAAGFGLSEHLQRTPHHEAFDRQRLSRVGRHQATVGGAPQDLAATVMAGNGDAQAIGHADDDSRQGELQHLRVAGAEHARRAPLVAAEPAGAAVQRQVVADRPGAKLNWDGARLQPRVSMVPPMSSRECAGLLAAASCGAHPNSKAPATISLVARMASLVEFEVGTGTLTDINERNARQGPRAPTIQAMPQGQPGEITGLLAAWRSGDADAPGRLFALVYEELRFLARGRIRRGHDPSLGATGLVHEAYLKLVDHERLELRDRGHFFALASRGHAPGAHRSRPPPRRRQARQRRLTGRAGRRRGRSGSRS